MSWTENAACRGTDVNDWFPPRGAQTKHYARLKSLCAQCPVQERCLEEGLVRSPEGYVPAGVWGGLTQRERIRLAKSRPRQPRPRKPPVHGTEQGYHAHVAQGIPMCEMCRMARNEAMTRRRHARKEAS